MDFGVDWKALAKSLDRLKRTRTQSTAAATRNIVDDERARRSRSMHSVQRAGRVGDVVARRLRAVLSPAMAFAAVLLPAMAFAGEWKTKVTQIWDEKLSATVNRTHRIWDLVPEKKLDFTWFPDDRSAAYTDGIVSGTGRLTWRRQGADAFSSKGEVSTYKGAMRNGRPEGKGDIVYASGATYSGDWRGGLPDGRGVMRFPNGDEYDGELQGGRPQGVGRSSTADGAVYAGTFRNGQRDGSGVLSTADGRSFQTAWLAGKLVQDPAQSDGATAPNAIGNRPDGLTTRVLVDRAKNWQIQNDDSGATYYVYDAERQPGIMRVALASPRIMSVWKGNGNIAPTGSPEDNFSQEEFAPVFLAADIENRGSQPLQVTDAYLTVADSVTDLQPYLQAFSGVQRSMCGMVKYEPRISFTNRGWGTATGVGLRFRLGAGDLRTGPITEDINDITETSRYSIENTLMILGAKVSRLRTQTYNCKSRDLLPACLKRVEANGDLGALAGKVSIVGSDVYTNLDGQISYAWTDKAGGTNRQTSPVSIDIPLIHFKVDEPECGAPGPTEYAGRVITLPLDRANYRLPLNWHGDLRPREDKRFAFSLVAPKSSRHRFRLTVDLADGSSLSSLLVDLTYFRPRPFAVTANAR